MPRSGSINRISLEEKGQRAARSTDVYQQKAGLGKTVFCRKCGMFYRNKRWVMESDDLQKVKQEAGSATTVCPACQRMADGNPAGIVTLSGPYLLEHEEEILNTIRRTEAGSRFKNPLGRIMEIRQEHELLTIATTEDKLAQKLGREIYKAHRGELHYQWSHEEKFVRVNWTR